MNEEFVIADTHFGHRNIILHCNRERWIYNNPNYNPNKPYHIKNNNPNAVDVKKHDEELIEFWNKTVGKKDIITIVGDFAFRNHNYYIKTLNGKKRLVIGNHDKMSLEKYNLFDKVYDFGCRRKVQKQDVTFCHYSLCTWANSCHGAWCLYGHSHGRLMEWENQLTFDVGVDVWGYTPIPWEVIKAKMKLKTGHFDGETKSKGQFINNPKDRVIETRRKNMNLLKQMGIKNFVEFVENNKQIKGK